MISWGTKVPDAWLLPSLAPRRRLWWQPRRRRQEPAPRPVPRHWTTWRPGATERLGDPEEAAEHDYAMDYLLLLRSLLK